MGLFDQLVNETMSNQDGFNTWKLKVQPPWVDMSTGSLILQV